MHFDKLKPEPGLTRKARPDITLCCSLKLEIFGSSQNFGLATLLNVLK